MNFEDLEVWKRSARLCSEIYKTLEPLRNYAFRDQITRSSLSVPSNIAEGFERISPRECLQFLSYAKGSCGELRTQIYIGMETGYIPRETGNVWIREVKEISAMIFGLIRTKRAQGAP